MLHGKRANVRACPAEDAWDSRNRSNRSVRVRHFLVAFRKLRPIVHLQKFMRTAPEHHGRCIRWLSVVLPCRNGSRARLGTTLRDRKSSADCCSSLLRVAPKMWPRRAAPHRKLFAPLQKRWPAEPTRRSNGKRRNRPSKKKSNG